jgi:protein-S-isoprenylcysteine O-methyltransferase Ste14
MHALELKIPPVAFFLLCAAVMWTMSAAFPALTVPGAGRQVIAVILVLTGVSIALAGVFAFRRHNTTTNPMTPGATKSVVRDGIYRFTRNPMYLGLALVLAGWATFLAGTAALLPLPVFVAYMTRFQIRPEERVLLANFEADYAAYMSDVRRWV